MCILSSVGMSQNPKPKPAHKVAKKLATNSNVPLNLTTGGNVIKKNAKGGVLVNPTELHMVSV